MALLALALAQPPAAESQALTQKEKTAVLRALNQQRANLKQPPAIALPVLTWDPALETIAHSWALSCTADTDGSLLAHNPYRNASYPGSVGENIAGWRGPLTLAALMNAVNQWGGEARDYNIVHNTCAGEPNSIHHQWRRCAHYTQIVTASTTKVGCARSVCPNLTFPVTIVCDFGDAGNVYDASTGTVNRPYELGARDFLSHVSELRRPAAQAVTARHLLKPGSGENEASFAAAALTKLVLAAARRPPSNEDSHIDRRSSSLGGLRRASLRARLICRTRSYGAIANLRSSVFAPPSVMENCVERSRTFSRNSGSAPAPGST